MITPGSAQSLLILKYLRKRYDYKISINQTSSSRNNDASWKRIDAAEEEMQEEEKRGVVGDVGSLLGDIMQ